MGDIERATRGGVGGLWGITRALFRSRRVKYEQIDLNQADFHLLAELAKPRGDGLHEVLSLGEKIGNDQPGVGPPSGSKTENSEFLGLLVDVS